MNFQSQVAHALDEEHRVNLDLLGKVEQAFARMPRSGAGAFGRRIRAQPLKKISPLR